MLSMVYHPFACSTHDLRNNKIPKFSKYTIPCSMASRSAGLYSGG